MIDKRCAYEESMRIPLLAHGPSLVPPGTRCDALIANIDIAPTLLDLAGVLSKEAKDEIDGRSFARLLETPSATESWRTSLLYEYYWEPAFPQTPTTFALRTTQYKLIQYHGIWDTDELFDITQDPHETRNLIREPEFQERTAQMRRQLHAQLKKTGGLAIPLGFKRDQGANLRSAEGAKRAEFPADLLRKSSQTNSSNK